MFKKKLAKKAAKHDFTALDAAVSELSKQTAALLGTSTDEKKAKPVLPKKSAQLKSRGQSFDIISPQKSSQPAHLKTVATPDKSTTQPEHELLPEHAGLSFNETESEQSATEPAVAPDKLISGHRGGRLSEVPETDLLTEDLKLGVQKEYTAPQPAARQPLSFKDEPKAEETPIAPTEVEKETTPTEPTPPSQPQDPKEPEQAPNFESAGLYANNLVKKTKSKGYEPLESQQKPTVFDTNEYHEELHDWSKLEGGGRAKIALLILLLMVAGGVAYFIISGQQLPF